MLCKKVTTHSFSLPAVSSDRLDYKTRKIIRNNNQLETHRVASGIYNKRQQEILKIAAINQWQQ